ncbi:DUF1566 domain-containing protein [Dokdonella soli]|uniref:Lcl C-terminal domain-containing protein n=1 Tax=Dokdonella soli TaxID=529810 RepID=A0ABN1IUG2_9GAMM
MNVLTLSFAGNTASALRIDLGGVSTVVIGNPAINDNAPSTAAAKPARQRINVPGGFIIVDHRAGLEWSHDLGDMTHAEGDAAAKACRLGGHEDWRLPTLDEQETNRDITRYNPACDPIFTDMKSSAYWTASPVASYPDYAWIVYFDFGGADICLRPLQCRVRAVRSVARASQ